MSKRRTSNKQQKKNNQLILAAVGAAIIVAVVFGILSQRENTAAAAPQLEVTVQEAYELYQKDVFILDVRTPEEWVKGHVPGATLIPLNELESRISELPKGEEILVICRSGNRSSVGRDILLAAGFEYVSSVDGGFNQWVNSGYPTEVGQ